MPTPATKSRQSRSSRSPARKGRSSRSRSRSRGRSKSPARTKAKSSPSPARARPSRSRTPPREKKERTAEKPVRVSSRIAALQEAKEKEQEEQNAKVATETVTKVATSTKTTVTKATRDEVDSRGTAKQAEESCPFGGPYGALITMLNLPLLVILLNRLVNKESADIRELPAVMRSLLQLNTWRRLLSLEATAIFVGWFLFQVVLAVLPFGRLVDGQPIQGSNRRLKYRCNGFYAFLITAAVFAGAWRLGYPVTQPYELFLQLATTAILLSTGLAVYLAVRARKATKRDLAPAASSGSAIYNFFMGRELNPRIGPLDLKFFCELRPGLIGWTALNAIFVLKAVESGSVPPELLLTAITQAIYVVDGLFFEEAILSTMDITEEGFGWMLAFGDLAWVPFLYTLQCRYLVLHPQNLSWLACGFVALMFAVGFLIFRGSNSQKNAFRKNPYDPALAHLESIPTSSGKRLLVSGWWGICRHPNYLGDLLMATSWSLACGFGSVLPWFYPVFLLVLLVHRQARDDQLCHKKYGGAWERYRQRVRYRIIPYVY